MANTKIQIKRSTITSAPTTLDIGELAYSYTSNTLYIGNTTGTGVLAIAGALLSSSSNNYAGAMANAANAYANTVGLSGNNYAGFMANAGNSITYTVVAANLVTARAYTNTSTDAANNYAGVMANAANTIANATYVKKVGDTITGDLTIQGNLTTSGVVTYANTQTLLIGDALITLNNDIPAAVAPSEDAGVEVKRGSSANVALLWNEGSDKWTFTNDGTNYRLIASNTDVESANNYAGSLANAAGVIANAAFLAQNNQYTFTNTVYAAVNSAFAVINAAYTSSNADYVVTNAAFTQSNTDNVRLSAAYVSLNAAYVVANAAFGTANLAFAAANQAGVVANVANSYLTNTFSSAANLTSGTLPSARLSGSYTGITGVGTITTGTWNGSTITVPYGGTGATTFTANGILYGDGTNPLKVTAAGTDGQVLQSDQGLPKFAMLDGGSF